MPEHFEEERTLAAARPGQPAGPCAMVIFGASGDLTKRKLLPALINLARDRLLPDAFAVLGNSRSPMTDEEYRDKIAADLKELVDEPVEEELWQWLRPRLFYFPGNIQEQETYTRLRERLEGFDRDLGTGGNRLFYLSTSPDFFGTITHHLAGAGMLRQDGSWRRVVIEKPFGIDSASARQLNRTLREVLDERQIYRIDHYLGKETVQNLLVFRFANGIFEPLWNHKYIDHVQITVAESVGVEGRGGYFDGAGTLRDMVPNHLFQLLSLVGMEPPASLDADAIRDEQVKVLRSVRPLETSEVGRNTVRGQYGPGNHDGKEVPGYRSEPKVPEDSNTETFAALKLDVDNWRWAGIPFYLRTGKRLPVRRSEIVVQFRQAPHLLFRNTGITSCQANRLVLNLQPDEGITLRFGAKVPGPVVKLDMVAMDFDYAEHFGNLLSTGYERLLYECMQGDATLFQRADMVEMAWKIVAPIQECWAKDCAPIPRYPAGSWGPKEAARLLENDGRTWQEADGCA